MKKNNPFELTFGLKPDNYISRIKQSEEIISSFSSKRSGVYMIVGPRGTGKTVMLSSVANYFEHLDDWIVIELIPSFDMLDQLASKLYDSSLFHRIIDGKTFGFSFHGISFSIKGEKPVTNVLSLLEIIFNKIKAKNKKVLICIDEISNNEFARPFVQSFQFLLRKEFPVSLLMTGLYQNIYDLQNDKTLTFLYRAPKISLDPLNLAAIASSYVELLGTDEKTALELAKTTNGYAYAYQVLGYLLFEKSSCSLDADTLRTFDQYLQEYVYEKTWTELSSNDKKVLLSFKNDSEEDVASLLKASNFDKQTFSVYRDRLIKRGVVVSTGYGKLKLTLPRFFEFIKTKADY